MILLDGDRVSLCDLWRGATGEACELDPAALPAMEASRALVQRLAAQDGAVYGINTGFGALSEFRVGPQDQARLQLHLLHHLSVGQGPLYDPRETRAVVIARANSLARGYSGIRPQVVRTLLGAMNAGVLPEIPEQGTVGASGDLVPLAHMARLLVGLGHARTPRGRLPAAEALSSVGLRPAVLQAKEALALVNGTSVMTGLACLSAMEARDLLALGELLTAGLYEVLGAAPEPLHPGLHLARPHPGQIASAARIKAHLDTGPNGRHWGAGPKSDPEGVEIQAPYSLRCVPQILGACRDVLTHVEQVVQRELNSTTDNPVILPAEELVVHGGNFYGQHVGAAADYLSSQLITAGLLAERQLARLVDPRLSEGLPPMLSGGQPGLDTGFSGVQLLATSLAADLRLSGLPASIQTIPTNANNQDVVSMGTHAARRSRRVVGLVWRIQAILALGLAQAADLRGHHVLGTASRALVELVREQSEHLGHDRPLADDIARIEAALRQRAGELAEVAHAG